MSKKCVDCVKEAEFKIKGTSEYYCHECAIENFGDIAMLVALEEEAQLLKNSLEKLAPQEMEELEGND